MAQITATRFGGHILRRIPWHISWRILWRILWRVPWRVLWRAFFFERNCASCRPWTLCRSFWFSALSLGAECRQGPVTKTMFHVVAAQTKMASAKAQLPRALCNTENDSQFDNHNNHDNNGTHAAPTLTTLTLTPPKSTTSVPTTTLMTPAPS